jgi:N-acyl-D-aspartate/D-glutamate deacylase
MQTTIIRNGLYFDGLGNKGIKKDIVIKNNKIECCFRCSTKNRKRN